jgi:hypothetical protein
LTGSRALAVLVAGLLVTLGGCGGPAPSASSWPSAPPTAVVSPAPSASPATAGPSNSTPAGSSIESDPGLFAFIGGTAGALNFQYDPDTTAQVAADPGLAGNVSGLAIGLYTMPGQQPVADFAIVSVLHLRDPSVGPDWFRSYRDTYDAAACAQAGGIDRHSETTIGANDVFIGACAGGAFTYHVRLEARAIVVSITAAGPARLGERIAGDIGQ